MHKILQPKFKLFEDKCSLNCLDSFTNENKLTKIDPKKIIFGHHIFPLNFTWKWCFRWNSVRKTYVSIIFFWASKVNAAETLMYPVQKLAGKTYTTVTVYSFFCKKLLCSLLVTTRVFQIVSYPKYGGKLRFPQSESKDLE